MGRLRIDDPRGDEAGRSAPFVSTGLGGGRECMGGRRQVRVVRPLRKHGNWRQEAQASSPARADWRRSCSCHVVVPPVVSRVARMPIRRAGGFTEPVHDVRGTPASRRTSTRTTSRWTPTKLNGFVPAGSTSRRCSTPRQPSRCAYSTRSLASMPRWPPAARRAWDNVVAPVTEATRARPRRRRDGPRARPRPRS